MGVQIHCAVRDLEAGLEDISLSQQYSNRGIYILCKVRADAGPCSLSLGP